STPYSACGVEINLFSGHRIYDFNAFKKNILKPSSASSIYIKRIIPNIQRLHHYGLSFEDFQDMLQKSDSLSTFSHYFEQQFLALRGKPADSILFEETPQNINTIEAFLGAFPKSYFVHLVRNPIYVYPSLLKRNFPPFVALLTWLFDVAKYVKHIEHERTICLRYEDLVQDPFTETARLVSAISGKQVSATLVEQGYQHNGYRQQHSLKVSSWGVREYGTVKNANHKILSEPEKAALSQLYHVKISDAAAEYYNISPLSFKNAIEIFGYTDDIAKIVPCHEQRKISRTRSDTQSLMKKWLVDRLYHHAKMSDMAMYVNPIEYL
ncbi:MAG: hypothetical protein HN790_00835, partial [Methylococcales bacterium]|nr:hypothetical protein [Methylococcales bacterium]